MQPDLLPTEFILTHPRRSLGEIQLDWTPQPGHHVALKGETYAVLERHHHYRYRVGGYRLHKISLYVQTASTPNETSTIEGRTVIGDASCRFNARSELIRCAIEPDGPCKGCRSFELSGDFQDLADRQAGTVDEIVTG